MPDWKAGSQNEKPDRLLLNFVLTPKEDKFIAHLRKQMGRETGRGQCSSTGTATATIQRCAGRMRIGPKLKRKKEFPAQWFANRNLKSFRLLSVDLGQKQAGAYAIIEVSCSLTDDEKNNGPLHWQDGTRRASGEIGMRGLSLPAYSSCRAKMRRSSATPRIDKNALSHAASPPQRKGFREELSGSAGRLASPEESGKTVPVADRNAAIESLG